MVLVGAGCSKSPLGPAKPTDPTNGHLIKGTSYTTVYFLGVDGKRYVFPTEKTYLSWFDTFAYVKQIADNELIKTSLGGNVTYKPGSRLIKIDTDPKVYVVTKSGVLRWIETEELVEQFYGPDWRKHVDDVPDAFFTNYTQGPSIPNRQAFSLEDERKNITTIDHDKGLKAAQ